MDKRGQSALEYLMTYGWALIVIAIVIGVLIFVTSGATGGVTCQSQSTGLVLKEWAASAGTAGAGITLMNATGGQITVTDAAGSGSFAGGTEQWGLTAAAKGIVNLTVPKNSTFVVVDVDAPAAGNTLSDATIAVSYTTEGGLLATATITCNGTV